MEKRIKRRSGSYKDLVRMVSNSSGYHMYEVEDVMNHLIGNMQLLLSQGKDVKLYGIGKIRVVKMDIKKMLNGREVEYTTYRMALSSDEPMRRYMKENYIEKSETE
jgi:nucleoid DNA-binding protein